ncbi:MAG: peptide MFS transporter [Marinilabiliaceae bacterium]
MAQQHPKGLYTLFFTEMWERFSYYGMRALLILYMTRQILYGDNQAYGIYAAYAALVYATPFLGGVIADQILGYRKSIIFGAVLMAIGHFLMAIESDVFFFSALAFIIIGNGFFKPNISSMVGGLYEQGDKRRDGGFTIFYMGINLGAFFSPLACGLLGELFGWHYGFGLAGIGMVAGLWVFLRGQRNISAENGAPPHPETLKKPLFAGLSKETLVYIGTIVIIPLLALLIYNYHLMDYVLTPFVIVVFAGLLIMSFKFEKVERQRIWVILILAFFSITFWALFEQAGSSITLFTENNVNRDILGLTIPTSVFQAVNPLFIIIFAPIFASLWLALARRNKEPNTTIKFSLGIIQLGIGFGIFVLGAGFAGDSGLVPVIFLLFGYLLHTTGELCISPVGLSMVSRLAPARLVAMVMGAWFLSFAMAQHLGGSIAQLTSTERFMETGLTYEPVTDYTGKDNVKLRTYSVNEGDTLYSEPLTVNLDVIDEPVDNITNPQDILRVSRAVEPGNEIKVNLRHPYMDPTGDLTNILFDEEAQHGDLSVEGDTLVYKAHKEENIGNGTVRDTLEYQLQEKEIPERISDIRLIVTVSDQNEFTPSLVNDEMTVNVQKATVIRKSFNTINVLGAFNIADGSDLGIDIVEEPENGYALTGNMLNPFVGPTKTIHVYSTVFFYLFVLALGVGFVVFLLTPILKKWMHGEN